MTLLLAPCTASATTADLAVLRVHRSATDALGLGPLAIATDSASTPALEVGQRVVAIGSPLPTEHMLANGIVSKLDPDVVFPNIDTDPGNSGGPLLNLRGAVVRVSTFATVVGGSAVSGGIRIGVAARLVEAARQSTNTDVPEGALPVESGLRLTPDVVKAAPASYDDDEAYDVIDDMRESRGRFDVYCWTPFVKGRLEAVEARGNAKRLEKHRGKAAPVQGVEGGAAPHAWENYSSQPSPVEEPPHRERGAATGACPAAREDPSCRTYPSAHGNTARGTRLA